jgi:predicted transcriptional regulator
MYRARWQIWEDILAATTKGARKTEIMYHASVNGDQNKRYLRELIKLRCIVCRGTRFKATGKGKRLMNLVRELQQLAPGV